MDPVKGLLQVGCSCCFFFLAPDLARPEGITYDWTAKNIYWTDTGKKVIGVARSDGSYQKVLISSDVAKPRGIIVHPMKG